jgi:hypothetical protein
MSCTSFRLASRFLLRALSRSVTLAARGFMAFECSECGQSHDELPRYFMCRLPERADGSTIDIEEDHKSMGRK